MRRPKKRYKSYVPFFKRRKRFRKASRDWDDPRYKAWREAVFERDSYRCVICGKKGRIEAHHIYSYSDHISYRYNINFGVTLCANSYRGRRVIKFGHHSQFHKIYGKGGNNLAQWLAFKAKYGRKN